MDILIPNQVCNKSKVIDSVVMSKITTWDIKIKHNTIVKSNPPIIAHQARYLVSSCWINESRNNNISWCMNWIELNSIWIELWINWYLSTSTRTESAPVIMCPIMLNVYKNHENTIQGCSLNVFLIFIEIYTIAEIHTVFCSYINLTNLD